MKTFCLIYTTLCKVVLVFALISQGFLAQAAGTHKINEVHMQWAPGKNDKTKNDQVKNDQSSKESSAAYGNKNLSALKKFENERSWSQCADKAPEVFAAKNELELRPWILLTWMHCARRASDAGLHRTMVSAFQSAQKNADWFITGPWKDLLSTEKAKAALLIFESRAKLNKLSTVDVSEALQLRDRLDKDSVARLWNLTGEMAIRNQQWEAALYYFQLSLQLKEIKAVRDRYNFVRTTLSLPVESKKEAAADVWNEEEQKWDERLQNLLKQNDLVGFVENSTKYLSQFPGGKRSKFVMDKISEIFQNVSDLWTKDPNNEKNKTVHGKIVRLIGRMEASRVEELVRSAHRRNDFSGVLDLVDFVLNSDSRPNHYGVFLYMAGRSAQFLGQYAHSNEYFDKYISEYTGGEELAEVVFRSGLNHLRLNQWSAAAGKFEKVFVTKNGDRYETSSRYWLIRSLQKIENSRADELIKELLQKQPFSYYAIRLSAEKNNQTFDLNNLAKSPSKVEAKHFLLPHEELIVQRAQKLSANGWVMESQLEMAQLSLPLESETQLLWALRLKNLNAYPQVIKLVNDAFSDEEGLRTKDFLASGFPKPFPERIDEESRINALSPDLIRSLMRQESAFAVRATSTSQAMGLMQLIPPTADEVATDLRIDKMVINEDSYEPNINIRMGSRYLARMIRLYGGNVPMGLGAYNAGPGRMSAFISARAITQEQIKNHSSSVFDELWFDEVPWYETSFYIKAILRNSLIYRALDQGRVSMAGIFWQDLVKGPEISRHQKQVRWTASSKKSNLKRSSLRN